MRTPLVQGGDWINGAIALPGGLIPPLDAAVRCVQAWPASPDSGLRDPARYEALLAAAGFTGIGISEVPVVWRPRTGQEILDVVYNGSRSSKLLEGQNPEAREKIDRAILDFAAPFKTAEGFEILRLAELISAKKN